MKCNIRLLSLLAMLTVAASSNAQTSFDPEGGCLNIVDVCVAKGLGQYGDGGVSANYLHEKFINERFSIGPGAGYSYHQKYKFSAILIYLSSHYFFLDKRFSPFVNLRLGGYAMFNTKNVGANEKNSLSKEKQSFSLYFSPSVGLKIHITPSIGIMASVSDEAYLVNNAYDIRSNGYKSKLVHGLGISIGACFQINGW